MCVTCSQLWESHPSSLQDSKVRSLLSSVSSNRMSLVSKELSHKLMLTVTACSGWKAYT